MDGLHAAAMGRVGRDAELRFISNGRAVLNFPLAVEDRKKREGDPTQWIQVSVWGPRAEELEGQVRKGALYYVEGTLRTRAWTDQHGGRSGTSLDMTARRCESLFEMGAAAPRPRQPEDRGPVSRGTGAPGHSTRTDDDARTAVGFDANGDILM